LRAAAAGYVAAVRLITVPGVFRPRSDAWLMAGVLRAQLPPRADVVEPFTGSGVLAIAAALAGARRVTAIDLSRRAVACAAFNARLNGARVRVRRGDLFGPVAGERFDAILANPPYLPSATGELPRRGARRAWEGGPDGRALLDRLCDEAPGRLRTGGVLLIVQSSVCGVDETLERLRARGLRSEVVASQDGELGPLLAARAPELEARGLLRPGQRDERIVVIRGGVAAPVSGNRVATPT
jgi:release factor glutamine methyltransferase